MGRGGKGEKRKTGIEREGGLSSIKALEVWTASPPGPFSEGGTSVCLSIVAMVNSATSLSY